MASAGTLAARSQSDHDHALIALYRINELPFHLQKALDNGVTKEEIGEVITHLAFYAGWPAASTATTIARRVFTESKS